ncbi:MAG: 6-carboxytetrahydropterin synthase [Crocinitomicaceae bacterium]|jgi:6-pyruvoyltetrahydropterin/6-carboxytetrahydropterin synthase|nr:6-carboxytetrahydropterin synthase [Crocinitomicaceae bacterium]
MKVCRRATFNAAHRLFNAHWTDEQNLAVFGKCSNPNFHGHNYVFETWVEGEINQETGYVIDLKHLKEIINNEVLERFDHRNLNLDCLEFSNLKPSAENIAKVIWELIRPHLAPNYQLMIRLWETENNSVEYNGK